MRLNISGLILLGLLVCAPVIAKTHLPINEPAVENYLIDTEGAHAFIQFKVSHLGFSYIYGRFNRFEGSYIFNKEDFAKSSIKLTIDTASIDSNHAERDKHLRNHEFLDVEKYPKATFASTRVVPHEGTEGKATLYGDLTLHGVTKDIAIEIEQVGKGTDPWGGFRRGFEGTTEIVPQDFGIGPDWLGPIQFNLIVEGIRQ